MTVLRLKLIIEKSGSQVNATGNIKEGLNLSIKKIENIDSEIYLTRVPNVDEYIEYEENLYKVNKLIHFDKPNTKYYSGVVYVKPTTLEG